MRGLQLAACAFVTAFAFVEPLCAEPAATTPAEARETSALPLHLELAEPEPGAEAIRLAIQVELGRPVLLAAQDVVALPSLTVATHRDHTVTISYRTASGAARTRSIGLPRDPARSAEVIALLAGNLSRDEAAELLAELSNKKSESSAVPASEAPNAPNAPSPAQTDPVPLRKPVAQRAEAKLASTPDTLVNLSLVPPLTLFPNTEQRRINLELGFLHSHVGEIRGAGLGLFALRSERAVHGASLATFYNRSDGDLRGFAAAAIVNRTRDVYGVELSGIVNLRARSLTGLSMAGVVNLGQDVEGLQAAGIVNRARHVEGVQLAGVTNVAQQLNGVQIGVVNVAGDVHGLQLGVVNVAKHVDGAAIGLVSVADNARIQPVLWASSLLPLNVAMKFTIGPVYSQAGVGYGPANDTYTYELGLGAHLRLGRFFIEPGFHYSEMRSARRPFDHELIEHGHYRVATGMTLKSLSPFVGVGILQRFAHSVDAPASDAVRVEGFAGVACF